MAKTRGVSEEEFALQFAQLGFLELAAALVDTPKLHPAKIGKVLKVDLEIDSKLHPDDIDLKRKNDALIIEIDSVLSEIPSTQTE